LEKAFSLAKVVYSMHKYSTKVFVEAISRDFGFEITDFWRYEFPIKAAFKFHEKPVKFIDVGLWRMKKR
jgi:predicted RNA methylase